MIGTLSNLPAGLSAIAQWIARAPAEIKLENGEAVLVPLINLEVVG